MWCAAMSDRQRRGATVALDGQGVGSAELERWLYDPKSPAPTLEEVAAAFDCSFDDFPGTDADALAARLRLSLAVLRDVFPTDAALRRWLRAPSPELAGERPLDLIRSGRTDRLEEHAIDEWNRAASTR